MKKCMALLCMICILLTGCSDLLDGRYVSVTPYVPPDTPDNNKILSVGTYDELVDTLLRTVENGQESALISVINYNQTLVDSDMGRAIRQIMARDPICAYAVSEITYDVGTSAGQPAVAISISYLHGRSEIRKIQRPMNWAQTERAMSSALDECSSGLVLYLKDYRETDFSQWVSQYATANPDKVMEHPTVTINVYPESGVERVVELKFSYQNTRDALEKMQESVTRTFSAAAILAGGEEGQMDKYRTIYSLLMMSLSQQFRQETSITPAYSLLEHGVGDSRAVATVYAAMCARAGLECLTVTGNDKDGEPWFWNIICCDGMYYHLNLLQCREQDAFLTAYDADMRDAGFVWDFNGYPASDMPLEVTE